MKPIIMSTGRCVTLTLPGINITLGARIQSAWCRFKERLVFARAQPVDIFLGSRYL
jgi:hypothetical protein